MTCLFAALFLSACGGDESDSDASVGSGETLTIEASPSGSAREALSKGQLSAAMQAADELGFDWTVIAAVMELESPGRTSASAADRAFEVAYSLDSLGARYDYNVALAARGGPEFARKALAAADSYRGEISSEVPVPAESAEFDPPVDGAVMAGFGRLYGRPHLGLDFDAHDATDVRAAATGVVTEVGSFPAYGRFICLVHRFPRGLAGRRALNTCYGYLRETDRRVGEVIQRGETVGRSGCSGACISPRVHFMVRAGERPDALPIDPAPFVAGR